MKKNLLFVIPTMRMGGAEKSLVSLLQALDPDRVNADLFLFEAGGPLQREIPSWVNVISSDPVTRGMVLELRFYLLDIIKSGKILAAISRIWMSLSAKFIRGPRFSWKYIERHIPALPKQYDIAFGCLEGFTDFFVIDKVKALRKIGWIHTNVSLSPMTIHDVYYYSKFDRLLTISDHCLEAFQDKFPTLKDKIEIIENIVLSDVVKAKAVENVRDIPSHEKMRIVTVGRLDYAKGIDLAVRACKVLSDRGLDFCWCVYGQGVMRDEILKYVKENHLEDCFRLEGSRENPYPYMYSADVLVQPSRNEGKSLVLDEAKILGKAIVSTNYHSVTDQLTHNVTGVITEMNPEKLADGIQRVLEDHVLKSTLEQNCREQPNESIRTLQKFYDLTGI